MCVVPHYCFKNTGMEGKGHLLSNQREQECTLLLFQTNCPESFPIQDQKINQHIWLSGHFPTVTVQMSTGHWGTLSPQRRQCPRFSSWFVLGFFSPHNNKLCFIGFEKISKEIRFWRLMCKLQNTDLSLLMFLFRWPSRWENSDSSPQHTLSWQKLNLKNWILPYMELWIHGPLSVSPSFQDHSCNGAKYWDTASPRQNIRSFADWYFHCFSLWCRCLAE